MKETQALGQEVSVGRGGLWPRGEPAPGIASHPRADDEKLPVSLSKSFSGKPSARTPGESEDVRTVTSQNKERSRICVCGCRERHTIQCNFQTYPPPYQRIR